MLLGLVGGPRTGLQRIRFDDDAIEEAVAAVRDFMARRGGRSASWWLSEHSTPADVEERLLAAGAGIDRRRLPDRLDAAHPHPPRPRTSRRVRSRRRRVRRRDRAAIRRFDLPAHAPQLRSLAASSGGAARGDVGTALCGLGRRRSPGRGAHSSRRRLPLGRRDPRGHAAAARTARSSARAGTTPPAGTPALVVQAGPMSAPILRRLGFEKVCRFRRLEDVASTA